MFAVLMHELPEMVYCLKSDYVTAANTRIISSLTFTKLYKYAMNKKTNSSNNF